MHCRLRPCQREAWAGCTCTGRNTLAFTNSILPPAQVVSTVLRLCLPMHLHTTDLAQYPLALALRPRRFGRMPNRDTEFDQLPVLGCVDGLATWLCWLNNSAYAFTHPLPVGSAGPAPAPPWREVNKTSSSSWRGRGTCGGGGPSQQAQGA